TLVTLPRMTSVCALAGGAASMSAAASKATQAGRTRDAQTPIRSPTIHLVDRDARRAKRDGQAGGDQGNHYLMIRPSGTHRMDANASGTRIGRNRRFP